MSLLLLVLPKVAVWIWIMETIKLIAMPFLCRKENLSPPLDFPAYRNWLRSTPASSGLSNEAQGLNGKLQNEPSEKVQTTSSQQGVESKPQTTTSAEPTYPSSFAHIVELITTGQPVPGIQEIPDTVLTGQEAPSTLEKRRKPWEKLPVEDSGSQG